MRQFSKSVNLDPFVFNPALLVQETSLFTQENLRNPLTKLVSMCIRDKKKNLKVSRILIADECGERRRVALCQDGCHTGKRNELRGAQHEQYYFLFLQKLKHVWRVKIFWCHFCSVGSGMPRVAEYCKQRCRSFHLRPSPLSGGLSAHPLPFHPLPHLAETWQERSR